MNGENLLYDYRFYLVDEPTEWAFNWDYSECGPSSPTPRPHHASLWLTMNEDDPIGRTVKLFRQFGKRHPMKLSYAKPTDDSDCNFTFKVTHTRTKALLFEGKMKQPNEDGTPNDPNVGQYCYFISKTKSGTEMMKTMVANVVHGSAAFLPHDTVELMNDGSYRIVAVTGGDPPNADNDEDPVGIMDDIATRFTLFHNDEEVARCHMTYRDGSYDSSMGPTIEMIAVKQSRRGEGLAKVLWFYVLRFIETNFTLECLNNDAPVGHIMVKATQILTQEVEMRKRKTKDTMVPIGFKQLLYDYFGFSVRVQKGAVSFILGSRRPIEEEGVLYIPLLSKNELAKKLAKDSKEAPKPGDPFLRNKMGTRACMHCRSIGTDLLRCSKCEMALYCSASCQKKDWKTRHKLWCNKTREEVKDLLIQKGGIIKNSDGTECLNMSFQGMNFAG